MPLTTYAANRLIDHVNGKTSFTMPATPYIALFTAMPTLAGGGTEVVGGSYARQSPTWNAASSGSATNSADLNFTTMPGCTVVGFGEYDASTSGNLLWYNEIEQTVTGEAITLVGGIANLANANVSSVVVKDATDTTTYTEGTDYVVQYDSGTICRLSGSAFTSTATLHVTYQYPTSRAVTAGDTFSLPASKIGLALKGYK